jgi:hypothetical protein
MLSELVRVARQGKIAAMSIATLQIIGKSLFHRKASWNHAMVPPPALPRSITPRFLCKSPENQRKTDVTAIGIKVPKSEPNAVPGSNPHQLLLERTPARTRSHGPSVRRERRARVRASLTPTRSRSCTPTIPSSRRPKVRRSHGPVEPSSSMAIVPDSDPNVILRSEHPVEPGSEPSPSVSSPLGRLVDRE